MSADPNLALTSAVRAVLARAAAEIGPQPDPTLLPPEEGRRRVLEANRRWNRGLPAAEAREMSYSSGGERRRLRVLTPPERPQALILYVHGGGFATCSPDTHERAARSLARAAKAIVALPEYRLAPEHPFPAAVEDVAAALELALERPESLALPAGLPLILSGDSAGAALVVGALLGRGASAPRPAGALLFYGVFDARFDTPSHIAFGEGFGLTTGKMRRYWDWYTPEAASRADPRAAPLQASNAALAALPPLFLLGAGADPLLSETLGFFGRLAALGRPDRFAVTPGVPHGFLQMTAELEAARRAVEDAAAFVDDVVQAEQQGRKP